MSPRGRGWTRTPWYTIYILSTEQVPRLDLGPSNHLAPPQSRRAFPAPPSSSGTPSAPIFLPESPALANTPPQQRARPRYITSDTFRQEGADRAGHSRCAVLPVTETDQVTAGRRRGWGWPRSSAGGTGEPSHCCSLQARLALQGAVLQPRAAHRRNIATGSLLHTLQCCTVLQGRLGAGRGRGPGAQFRRPGHAAALHHPWQHT